MTFAMLLQVMGVLGFALSENALFLMLLVVGIGVATRDFEDLKQRVDWLEVRLDEQKERDTK